MIAILGAVDEEIESIQSLLRDCCESIIHDNIFYIGFISNKKVVLCKCGVGKVNSAITTSILLEYFDVDLIINVGIAGGNREFVSKCDIVVADKVSYGDVDLTSTINSKYVFGQMSGCPIFLFLIHMLLT